MFAPEGFLSFSDLTFWTKDIARDLVWAYRAKNVDGRVVIPNPAIDERDAVESWLFANFLDRNEVMICSPSGTLLRAPVALSRHLDELESFPEPPVPIENSLLLPPTMGDELDLSKVYYFRSRFVFVCFQTGRVTSPSDDILTAFLSKFDEFADPVGPYLAEKMRVLIDAMKDFEGWAICARKGIFGETVAEVYEAFGVDAQLAEKFNQGSALPFLTEEPMRRRSRKRDEAFSSYQKIFPDGHEAKNMSFKEAVNAVVQDLGYFVSDDTLRRALGKKS